MSVWTTEQYYNLYKVYYYNCYTRYYKTELLYIGTVTGLTVINLKLCNTLQNSVTTMCYTNVIIIIIHAAQTLF